ncbi:MAG TPA: extracellular solute-binding protein [Clostridiales bacterium]|nr:extracellular solute-binding protein [Clostridiales bacterium]
MKKLLRTLLAMLLVLSIMPLTAAFAQTIGTREAQPIPEGDWKTPYPTVVNITTVKGAGADLVFEDGDSHTNNPWTRAWLDQLGIEVTHEWVDDGNTQYDTKLNMTIATGNLPDVFKVNYVQFRQLVQADLLLDLTDYYNENLSQRIRDYEKTDPDTIKQSTVNGRIYGIPEYYYGIIDQPKDLWIRKDWYEDAGSPELKTIEDFENLAKLFMEKYGGYGLAIENKLENLFMTGPMFGVYLGNPANANAQYFWYKDDTGRIKAGIAHPEFKKALTYWAKWYEEGIISPDFANFDVNKMTQDLVNGKAGMQPHYQWQGWHVGPNLVGAQGSDNAYMIPFPFPTEDGSQVLGQIGFPNNRVIVVAKTCTNPAAVMKLLSFTDHIMFDPTTKLTEEEFKGYTDGQREHAPGSVEIIDPMADMIQFEHVLHALKTGETQDLFTAGMQKKYGDSISWIQDKNPGGLGAYLQQGFDGCAYYNSKFLIDNDFLKRTDVWGPPPEEFDKTVNTIDVLLNGVMEIIMGVQPVEYYDTVLANWYAQGGQIMEDAINAQYGGQ